MYEFLKLFFDICRLKKEPQDIPNSVWLLRLLIIIYILISFFTLFLSTDVINAILQVIVEISLLLGLTWIILWLAKKSERYQQTSCALIGTDALLSFIALPAIATMTLGQNSGLGLIAIIILMLWHWLVSGYIFGKALAQPFIFGLGVSFMYLLTSFQLITVLFPEVVLPE